MRKWGTERPNDFHEVIWLVSVRAAETPSWLLTPYPSPARQVSSSPLPTGPTQRRLSVSPSIGGETGLMSCVLPEDLLTQIVAERLQVRLCPPAQSCRAQTPSLRWVLGFWSVAPRCGSSAPRGPGEERWVSSSPTVIYLSFWQPCSVPGPGAVCSLKPCTSKDQWAGYIFFKKSVMIQPYGSVLKIIMWNHGKLEFRAILIPVKICLRYIIQWEKQIIK